MALKDWVSGHGTLVDDLHSGEGWGKHPPNGGHRKSSLIIMICRGVPGCQLARPGRGVGN